MTALINQHDSQGRLHGVWEGYRENGTVGYRHHFQHGKRYGLSEYFFSYGTPFNKKYYLRIK
jgi:antitoxin component YwqK of YwqJK toxin-antitoxin module